MKEVIIDLKKYVNPPQVDWISGRAHGEKAAVEWNLHNNLDGKSHFEIIVDDTVIKAINDSFVKGLFSDVFKKLKSQEEVDKYFTIKANDYFTNIFRKNFRILEEI